MSDPGGADLRRAFELGSWRVDPGLDRLRRDGVSVALEPRAMDLLVCLARHAGETVSKETLLAEVWKGAFVIEGVIPKTLSALRAALGDDAAAPTYILTVPRRGYRLVAPVRWSAEGEGAAGRADPGEELEAPPDSSPAGSGIAAVALRAPASSGDGVAEDRTARRRRLRWAVLALAGAAALGWYLLAAGEPPRRELARADPAVSESVARLLLEARHLWAQRGVDSVRRATELMQQAVREAPESAEAHAWLALSTITRASYLGGEPAACGQAAEEALRAIALDSANPIALCAQGVMAIQKELEPRAAIAPLERSVALDPTFVPARQFLAEALTLAGEHDRALTVIDQALALDPLSALLHGVRGNILQRADRPLAALEAYERVLVLEPKFTWVYRNRAGPLMRLGREREAVESLYSEARLTHERPEFLATLRAAIDGDGLAGYYRWKLGRLQTLRGQGVKVHPFPLAEAMAGAGQAEAALAELARAAVCPDADTFFYGRSSAAFDRLRDDPRFQAIYARFGL